MDSSTAFNCEICANMRKIVFVNGIFIFITLFFPEKNAHVRNYSNFMVRNSRILNAISKTFETSAPLDDIDTFSLLNSSDDNMILQTKLGENFHEPYKFESTKNYLILTGAFLMVF